MPAPGEQHHNSGSKTITNPFEEVKPRISEYTAQEIATLQSRLDRQLGPEYISHRPGPGSQRIHYLAAEKCIQLANEVFGFNGWSSQIMDVQVDFVDENPNTMKISLGLSVVVRVTLRDGTFHEDVGYGHMENAKGKAAAFMKAKKEGTTDGLKRALRNFGNVLGNCLYDKDYLGKVTKIKAQPTKFDVDNLHRHSTFISSNPVPAKKETEGKLVEEKGQNVAGVAIPSAEDIFEDEFGDFDDADFSAADPDSHPDEVALPGPCAAANHSNGRGGSTATNGAANQSKPSFNRPQSMAPPPNMVNNISAQPQTPNGGFSRSNSGAGRGARPAQESGQQTRSLQSNLPPVIAGRVLNQPSRNGNASAPVSPARVSLNPDSDTAGLPPLGAGFFSARAAAMLPDGQTTDGQGPPPQIPNNLPVFNPHLDSPSIRKTPGIDHKTSKPLNKDLKHVPGSSQVAVAPSTGLPPAGRPNVLNPQVDGVRRIGAPGSPSPHGNRGQYKPPTVMKRPADSGGGGPSNRTPLVDLPSNGAIGGGDVKRQRLEN